MGLSVRHTAHPLTATPGVPKARPQPRPLSQYEDITAGSFNLLQQWHLRHVLGLLQSGLSHTEIARWLGSTLGVPHAYIIDAGVDHLCRWKASSQALWLLSISKMCSTSDTQWFCIGKWCRKPPQDSLVSMSQNYIVIQRAQTTWTFVSLSFCTDTDNTNWSYGASSKQRKPAQTASRRF